MTAALEHRTEDAAKEMKSLALSVAALDDRLTRLTDAYIDKVIEKGLPATQGSATR